MPVYYYLALLSAFWYALSVLLMKKASEEGLGTTRIFFFNNLFRAPVIIPLFWLVDTPMPDWDMMVGPAFAAVMCFSSMFVLILAMRMGDVSIQTPLMGTKVLFVGLLSVMFLGTVMTAQLWIAASIAFLAVFLLGFSRRLDSKPQGKMILMMLLASFLFAGTDVTVAYYAPIVGEVWLVILMNVIIMLCSFLMIPFFRKGGGNATRLGWRMGLLGAFLIAAEESFYFWIVAKYKEPALTNIVYSSRGIWSIVLVATLGGIIGISEKDSSRRVVLMRLLAASLIVVSVVFTLLEV